MTQHSRSATARPPTFLRALCSLALGLLLVGCASAGGARADGHEEQADMPSLEALMGDWHVAARVPWFGERGRVAARFSVAADDGDATRITITRRWRDGFGEPLESDQTTARRDGPSGRFWKLRAWRVLPARLRVLEAAEDGSWLLLDSADHDHAWILTRAEVVGDDAYLELERRIRGHGVNTDKLRRVPQVPEQEGRLGFEPAAVPTPGR
ncbi:lipocalin family protein [Luteimonas arsenica]|uniref:lipocalin family protein n=1 Tax=Luteimonas arsenica TaxID=1586242 RepID=UPI001055B7B8|nr:lipocalin family protein [Luteimonas arsenica]